MPQQRIYLDHAATSPLRPEARAAMEEGFAIWANPSSPHAEGRKARAALEDARERCKAALDWDGELIFTSGASEAAALIIHHSKAQDRIVSAIEHDAFLGLDWALHNIVPMQPDAAIDCEALEQAAITGDVIRRKVTFERRHGSVVAIQHVNSETGTIQDFSELGATLKRCDALLAVDCAQSAAKLPVPEAADMAIVSAHKLGGPIGIGALLVRDFAMLRPTGGQERGYRRGTENLPTAMGMAAALEAGGWSTTPAEREQFIDRLGEALLKIGEQVDYIVPLTHPTMSAQALLIRLDAMGFAVSAGSACSSGTLKKSRVLHAFGVPDDVASRTIRVSLGWNTTPEELDAFVEAWRSLQ